MVAKANVVETDKSNKRKRDNQSKKSKKFKGSCHNCGKKGHKAAECRGPPKKKKSEANVAEVSDGVSEMDLCAVVSECNLVGNNKEWFVDTGATWHICANKWMFTNYKSATNEEQLFMGNSSTSKVEGKGKIVLKLTSG